jgi:hypothetical protein
MPPAVSFNPEPQARTMAAGLVKQPPGQKAAFDAASHDADHPKRKKRPFASGAGTCEGCEPDLRPACTVYYDDSTPLINP